ncbi:hypothetical protein GRI75_01095 [Altererythrobacter soli]|uniref:Lipoprotein n=1 Tax=Croceibacterium soli TaxID=1739690 RepID=A0A6I4URK0_9SPHN|nr:hypothetical protein [Croceibacterium soli]MXP40239.1 hypothetical protein [Croceibacterium soli]
MRPELSKAAALLLLPLLAACAAVPTPGGPAAPAPQQQPPRSGIPPTTPTPPPSAVFRAPQIMRMPGLERVIEQNAGALIQQFGTPRLDVREGDMRKLQFSGQACVLDVFLYPLRPGAEPVATYVDARRPSDGADVDRAACVAALARR